jgi:hypothetical protein
MRKAPPKIIVVEHLNPDEPVGAKRKSRFIGELKIEYRYKTVKVFHYNFFATKYTKLTTKTLKAICA